MYYYIFLKQVLIWVVLILRFNFSEISKIVDSNDDKAFWIGITDDKYEGSWLFDSNSKEADFNYMMFKWKAGEPNNWGGNEDCVHTWGYELNDIRCYDKEIWGKPIHGLCEIKGNHC